MPISTSVFRNGGIRGRAPVDEPCLSPRCLPRGSAQNRLSLYAQESCSASSVVKIFLLRDSDEIYGATYDGFTPSTRQLCANSICRLWSFMLSTKRPLKLPLSLRHVCVNPNRQRTVFAAQPIYAKEDYTTQVTFGCSMNSCTVGAFKRLTLPTPDPGPIHRSPFECRLERTGPRNVYIILVLRAGHLDRYPTVDLGITF